MAVKNLFKIYNSLVAKRHDWIQCNNYDVWIHRKFNKINKQTNKLLQKDYKSKWYSSVRTEDFLPFPKVNDEEFIYTIKGRNLKLTHLASRHVSNKTTFTKDINLESE